MWKQFSKTAIITVGILLFLNIVPSGAVFAEQEQPVLDDLYIEIGDALTHARQQKWSKVSENISDFETSWKETEASDKMIQKHVKELNVIRSEPEKNSEQIRQQLTKLSKALVAFDQRRSPSSNGQEHKKINQLLPSLKKLEQAIANEEFDKANTLYRDFLTQWNKDETIVRSESVGAYGAIETQLAFIRIGIAQTPSDKEKALKGVADLRTAINDFVNGVETEGAVNGNYSLKDAIQLLNESTGHIADGATGKASENLNQFLLIWPVVEGDVRTRDPKLYNEVENKVPQVAGMLQSQDSDPEKSQQIITGLGNRLQLISEETSYTFIDAFLILLREGMEAILIIAGLLAFLKKTNNSSKQSWIWGGAVTGLVASAALAVAINLLFSNITAATSREYLEGVIGLIAVIMMISVGTWLHKKTNINHWNNYIDRNLRKALAKGSLFSMATLSFLSIFREGAEMIIFYAGMAPSMATSQLLIGIGLGFVFLVIIGFVIIRYSAKIPLRPFFFVATWLIYILAFKMLGVSIHALQIANTLPVHYINGMPFVDWIGLYPTLETILPQVLLIILVIGASLYVKKSAKKYKAATSA